MFLSVNKMQAEATIFVLFALSVVCNSQSEAPGERCCFAAQYEAVYGGNVGYYQDETPGSMSEGFVFALDVTGQRVGSEGSFYYSSGLTLNIKTIQLFKEGKQFTIVNDVCTVTPLSSASAPRKCLPDSAKFLSHMNQGVNEMSLASWQLDVKEEGRMGNAYLSVSTKTCAPVGISFSGVVDSQGKQTYVLTSGGYFNITKGIADPDRWFTVPSSCTPADPKIEFSSEKMDFLESLVEVMARQSRAFS